MAKFACVEKHFPLWWRLAAFLAFPILLGGCLGGRSQHYYGQAPVTDRGSEEEEEEWRLRYRRNRPVPPAEFRVPPVPARDNSFREFDDKAFRGMDAQPSLPDLPGDRPAGKPYPYLPPRLASDGATAGHATPSPARPTGVAPPIAISEPPIRRPESLRNPISIRWSNSYTAAAIPTSTGLNRIV
ncbi:MAG: hypothetical protein LBE84_08435 [Planctomycetota bacterium]|nr:hypothetical protein [Planctomycetota bacterium]